MTENDQLEKNYSNSNRKIEEFAESEIRKIREQIQAIRDEARKISETIDLTPVEKNEKPNGKKINT